ncbi:MAG TPA: thioredoxin [Chthoniobacterales bacterium]|jgi:thioredoxin 1|nr:thioredoxin [Chthoniobacterales bacterium]
MENSAAITIDESNFDQEVTKSAQPVLVDFWAEWCGPCKMIAPILDEIAKEKAGTVKIAKVNVDHNQSLSFRYNIRAIPTLLFFKDGQVRDQVTGIASKKDLLNRLAALA